MPLTYTTNTPMVSISLTVLCLCVVELPNGSSQGMEGDRGWFGPGEGQGTLSCI